MLGKKQPILYLPFEGKLMCSQENNSKGSHSPSYINTMYAIDFTFDGKKEFYILASADGKAKVWKCCSHKSGKCNCGNGFGNQIRIYHGNYFTHYAHLSKIFVKEEENIAKGITIGKAGKTGLSGNVHLHWSLGIEAKSNAKSENFIPFRSVKAEKIQINEKNKKYVKSTYFKRGGLYESTNKKL